jgi:hypothetical protein
MPRMLAARADGEAVSTSGVEEPGRSNFIVALLAIWNRKTILRYF